MQTCFRYLRKARRVQCDVPLRRQRASITAPLSRSVTWNTARHMSNSPSRLHRSVRSPRMLGSVNSDSGHPWLWSLQRRCFAVEQIDVPNLGDSISEGAVASILKSVGQGVSVDEVVMEIETDKVTIEIRSPKQGVVTEILTEVDAEVAVGDALFKIDTEGKVDPSAAAAAAAPSATAPKASEPATAPASPPTPPPSSAASPPTSAKQSSSTQGRRIPSIQFKFGVRDSPASTAASVGSYSDDIEFVYVGEEYGRLGFSEVDIAIINSGGAEYLDVMQILQKKKMAKKK